MACECEPSYSAYLLFFHFEEENMKNLFYFCPHEFLPVPTFCENGPTHFQPLPFIKPLTLLEEPHTHLFYTYSALCK